MTRAEILAAFTQLLDESASVPASLVAEDKVLIDDLDLDSLSVVEVMIASEERFGVEISDDEMKELKTVGDVVSHIEKLLVSVG